MVLATRGERRWLRGPRRFGPTTPLFWTPIAILWESATPRTAHAQTARNSNGAAARRYRTEKTADTDMSHLSRPEGEGHPPHVNRIRSDVVRFAQSLVPENIRRPGGVGQGILESRSGG